MLGVCYCNLAMDTSYPPYLAPLALTVSPKPLNLTLVLA